VACDELRDDQQCPKCGSVPGSYDVDGEPHCWPHRQRMSSRYPVHSDFLFIEYIWKGGHAERFPNAKLYDGGTEEDHFSMSPYCEECQRLYEEWSRAFLQGRSPAEPVAAPDPAT
jgi:hypothetical protein